MATAAENLATALAGVSAKIAEVLANPLPNITVDGVSIDRMTYYRQLLDMQKAILEQQALVSNFEVVSVAR